MKRGFIRIIVIVAGVALLGLVVMLLWNAIIPELIGLNTITYLQAVGLFVLSKILFGGSGMFHQKIRHAWHNPNLREQVKGMNKEQKMEYIQEYMSKNK